MFNTFPSLLVYSFFAPLVLRIAIAMVFAYLSYHAFTHRAATNHASFVGGQWSALLAALAYSTVGLLLLVGAYTQLAALAGMALLGTATFARHAAFAPLSKSSVILTFVVLGSLLLTGAGALAFDLPL